MKKDVKSADRDYLRKGYWIKLEVGIDHQGYASFKPVFLNNDKLVPGGRSVRIFRVARGVERPELVEGEEWQARVVAYKFKNEKTRDKREKIIFFLDKFKRVERVLCGLVDDKTGWREVYSGSRLICTEIVDLQMKKEEFFDKERKTVVMVKSYFSRDGKLFKYFYYFCQLTEFTKRLREAKIDPQSYIKKLPRFNREDYDAF